MDFLVTPAVVLLAFCILACIFGGLLCGLIDTVKFVLGPPFRSRYGWPETVLRIVVGIFLLTWLYVLIYAAIN